MRKRMITILLAITMLLSSINTEAVFAQAAANVATPEDAAAAFAQETAETAAPEEAGNLADVMTGGLQRFQVHEVEDGSMSEVYGGSVDSIGKGAAIYSNSWDQYSSNFYYNQLPDSYQAYWDKLDTMCAGYLTGTKTFTSQRDSDGNLVYPTEAVTYTNMSSTTALYLSFMFLFSNPQYYFLSPNLYRVSISLNSGRIMLTVYPAFANGTARAQATARMKSVIDSWMVQINAQSGDLAKEKLAHDLICKAMIYDPGYPDASKMNVYNQVAYSVFCTNSTVCAGYSQAMQLLMNGAGIDCAVVTSDNHEWNIIRLNGTWYYVDITWDDNIADMDGLDSSYEYFNRSGAAFANDAPGRAESHTPEAMWNGYLPELIQDTASSKNSIGEIYVPQTTMAAPVITVSGSKFTITSPSGGTVYYTLDGSSPSIASTKAKKYTGAVSLSATTKIRAIATRNKYYDSSYTEVTATPKFQVIFNANGGYIGKKTVKTTTKTVSSGGKAGKLTSPKRKGYAFLGWFTKKSAGNKITASTKITGNTTYYAHWAKIKKASAAISSVKNSSAKAMTIKIKKVSTASGYQIRYSTKKTMASAKTKQITENSCTIKKLKKGKTYYVQVRMYQKESVSGKKTYGPWSKTKTVKIKK